MIQIRKWGMVFVLILTATALHAEEKRYEVESGTIEYAISGSGNMGGIQTQIEGKSKTLFKEWGNVELYEGTMNTVFMGNEDHTRHTIKIDNAKVYVVDHQKKVIFQYDPQTLLRSEHKDLAKSAKEIIQALGGKKTGNETIQGYACEIWETPLIKFWLHKGIMLKSEANIMGIIHKTEAVTIKLDASVSDEDLKLPDFPIKIKEESIKDNQHNIPQMTPEQLQQIQEMMKNFTQK